MARQRGAQLVGRIASRIRKLRAKRGLTQELLSERADIQPESLSRIEGGTVEPSLTTLERLAVALEVELVELIDGPGAA